MNNQVKLNDLGKTFILFKLQEKFLAAKPTQFGLSLKQAVKDNKTLQAASMVKDQIKHMREKKDQGGMIALEWCVGHSTIQLVDKLFP